MSWERMKLGDISNCIQPGPFGSQLHQSDYSEYGTPIVMPKDMVDGRISHGNLIRVSEEHVKRLNRHQVHSGDLMVARKGDVRKCVYITENEDGWMTGSDCLKVSLNRNTCFPKFVYYQLRSAYIGKWLEKVSIGATMPSLNTGLLSSIELIMPPLEIQRRIANILSAYDNLIENNQKQIKLLEEAAQRLYKEWFVDLRFPGYEHTPVVDGVPEGWKIKRLSSIAEINSRSISKDYPYQDIQYVDLSSVRCGLIENRTSYLLNEAPGRAKRIAIDGDIVWGMVRPNLKPYALVIEPEKEAVFSTGFAVITARPVPFSFLYCAATTDEFVGYLVNCTNGAAYPAVKPEHFANAQILVGDKTVLRAFNDVVEPILRRIHLLSKQNKAIAEARNTLLPKIIGGEIEV